MIAAPLQRSVRGMVQSRPGEYKGLWERLPSLRSWSVVGYAPAAWRWRNTLTFPDRGPDCLVGAHAIRGRPARRPGGAGLP